MKRKLRLLAAGIDLKKLPPQVVTRLLALEQEKDLLDFYKTSCLYAASLGDHKMATAMYQKYSSILIPEFAQVLNAKEDTIQKELDNLDTWALQLDLSSVPKHMLQKPKPVL